MPKIFLSYARQDKAYVSKLAESLRKEGVEVWLDAEQIRPGEKFIEAIERQLVRSDAIVTVISPQGRGESISPNVYFEAGMAIAIGKPVTFVVPEQEIKSGRVPFDIKNQNLLLRRAPSATARAVAQSAQAGASTGMSKARTSTAKKSAKRRR